MNEYPKLIVMLPGVLILVRSKEDHAALLQREERFMRILLICAAAALLAIVSGCVTTMFELG